VTRCYRRLIPTTRAGCDDPHISFETHGQWLITLPPPPSDIMAGTSSPVPVATAAGSTSAAISLKEVAKWDGKSQEIYKVLTAAFDAEDYPECIKDLRAREIEPLLYVDNLNKVGSVSQPLARFVTIGDRSLTASVRLTQNSRNDVCER